MTEPIPDPFAPPQPTGPPFEPPPGAAARAPAAGGAVRRLRWSLLSLSLLIAVNATLFGVLAFRLYDKLRQPRDARAGVPRIDVQLAAPGAGPIPEGLTASETRTISVFRKTAASVVYITTLQVRRSPFSLDATAIPAGTGSGFVWDREGRVVTNYHVIRGGNAARVTLSDQSSYRAKLVGQAPAKDIAVLKIDAPPDKLHPLARGSSGSLVVGQRALAIGNPFGLDHTLSVGVVSGLGREIKSVEGRPIFGAIQTDAAINPGNSGGPLLDSRGRLIGMNTAIYSPSGASAGIGFAIPVDTIARFVPELIAHGKITRPGLGIQFDPRIQARTKVQGILVLSVMDGSPAEKAGIRPTERDGRTGAIVLGDIIVGIDGQRVKKANDLFKALDDKAVGDEVTVKLRRGDETVEVSLKLAPLQER